MEDTGFYKVVEVSLPGIGKSLAINLDTLVFTFLVFSVIFAFCFILRRKMEISPGKLQVVFEDILNYFKDALESGLGEEGVKFLPFIVFLFLFVLCSNWLSIIPGFKAPTRDLNTTLALAVMVLIVAHANAIRTKGLRRYLLSYFKPYWFMFPSNVFSEFSKTLSHAFRLYGNMFASGIIIGLIPQILVRLFEWFGVPIGIPLMVVADVFFGLFIGAVQAFVFAVLAVAYISVLAG